MKDFDILCHKVFSTSSGQELLEMLFEQYVNREITDPEPTIMARNAAEHDLIIHIGGLVKHGGRRDTGTTDSNR